MSVDVLGMTITLGSLLTIIGIILSIGTFKRNSKKDVEEYKIIASEREARMVSIEKDVQYIRISIDDLIYKVNDHEKTLNKHDTDIKMLYKQKNK